MEELIQSVVTAMGIGASQENIHDALIARGISEGDTFLVMKAAKILYNDAVTFQQAQLKRATFRRVP